MATSTVTVNFNNTTIGVPSAADGVCMLVVHAVAVGSTFALETNYVLYKLSDLNTLGITDTYDSTYVTTLYRQVKEFYKEAGEGAVLNLIGIAIGANTMSDYIQSIQFQTIIEGLAYNNATGIRMLGVSFSPQASAPVSPDVFFGDVIPTQAAVMTLYNNLKLKKITFAAAIVDGNNMKAVNSLPDQSLSLSPQVAILITTLYQDSCASVGALLGVYARNPIQYNISNGTLGLIDSNTMFFTDGAIVKSLPQSTFDAVIAPKQYLFAKTIPGGTGYWYNDDATCDLSTKSLSNIANNRVRKKITDLLYQYLDTLRGTTPTQVSGNIPLGTLRSYSTTFLQSYIVQNNMLTVTNQTIGSEISGINTVFTNGTPNFAASRLLNGACNVQTSSGILNIVVNAQITTS